MIRGASAAKRAPPWQDLRAMHSRKAICSAFRIHGARILPMPARFGYTAAICCQEGALFPSEAPSGMHEARKLPRIAARERTTAKNCHGRRPMNAPRRNLAAVGRWGGQLAKRLREAAQRARRIRSPGFARAARKARPRAGIREAARRAHQVRSPGSKGGSTSKAWPRAKFAMVVLEAGSRGEFARQGLRQRSRGTVRKADRTPASQGGFAKQLDEQGQQGTKKAPLRRTAPSPQNYGRKPDPP